MTNLHQAKSPIPNDIRSFGGEFGAAGDIFNGVPQKLVMPATFNVSLNTAPSPFVKQTGEVAVWRALYAKHKGYEMAWGHILEESSESHQGTTFHFIPTELIEMGVRSEVLATIASEWFESHQGEFSGYVQFVDGPVYVPFSIRGTSDSVHEWLAQVFLPMHFRDLMHLWTTAACVPAPSERQTSTLPSRAPTKVSVIHKRILPNQDKLQLILMTPGDGGRMSFVMWDRNHGITISDWISIPRTHPHYMQPTTDFILDFHRSGESVIFETTMRLHEPAIVNLVDGLLAAAATNSDVVADA